MFGQERMPTLPTRNVVRAKGIGQREDAGAASRAAILAIR